MKESEESETGFCFEKVLNEYYQTKYYGRTAGTEKIAFGSNGVGRDSLEIENYGLIFYLVTLYVKRPASYAIYPSAINHGKFFQSTQRCVQLRNILFRVVLCADLYCIGHFFCQGTHLL